MANGSQVQAVQPEKKNELVEYFSSEQTRKAIKAALPKHLTVERYLRIVLTAFNRTPKLQRCSISSLWSAILWLSQKGLEPDGYKAHLIPYGDECKVVVDYKGLVDLARRSKEVGDIHADVVFERDTFSYEYGTNAHILHRPATGDRGKITHAYSCVVLKGFEKPSFEVMNIDEIYAVRDRSQGWLAFKAGKVGSSTWETGKPDEKEMMKKTVFRRHSKWLPVSEDFIDAIERDFDAPDFNQERQVVDLSPKEISVEDHPEAAKPKDTITEDQARQILTLVESYKIKDEDFRNHIGAEYGIETVNQLPTKDIDKLMKWVNSNRKSK